MFLLPACLRQIGRAHLLATGQNCTPWAVHEQSATTQAAGRGKIQVQQVHVTHCAFCYMTQCHIKLTMCSAYLRSLLVMQMVVGAMAEAPPLLGTKHFWLSDKLSATNLGQRAFV